MSLSLDLNRITCFCLMDTVNLIGWECMLARSNHRATPWSLAANGRRKMVSAVSLSPREKATRWKGQSAPICKVVDWLSSQLNMSYMSVENQTRWERQEAEDWCSSQVLQSPVQSCSQYAHSALIRAANVTWMNEWISASPAWRCHVSLTTSLISEHYLRMTLSGQTEVFFSLLSHHHSNLVWLSPRLNPPFC